MSYDIIYDKQFIKVENYYIPVVLIGSSNLFEEDGARVRNWWIWQFSSNPKRRQILYTEDEIMNFAEKEISDMVKSAKDKDTEESIRKNFSCYSAIYLQGDRSFSDKTYLNFFRNGIKKALTVEQLLSGGLNLYLDVYIFGGCKDKEEEIKKIMPKFEANTTESLKASIEKFNTARENVEDASCYIVEVDFSGGDWRDTLPLIKSLRKSVFSSNRHKEKKYIQQDYYYVLEQEGRILVRFTRHGGYKYIFRYEVDWMGKYVKRFRKEKEAQRYLKQVIAKRGGSWEVKKIEQPAIFKVAV